MPLILGFQKQYPDLSLNTFQFNRHEFPDVIFQESVDCVLSVMDHVSDDTESILISAGDTLFFPTLEEMYKKIQAAPVISRRIQTPFLIQMIAEGLGASIINEETVQEIRDRSGRCHCIPLTDDFCVTNTYLLWHKSSAHSRNFKIIVVFSQLSFIFRLSSLQTSM